MEVYLIRHTTPEVTAGVCYGRTDLAVREATFAGEVAVIRSVLPKGIERWWSSPLQRCTQLAGVLSTDDAMEQSGYRTDNRLIELDFGEWEGQPWASIDREALQVWSDDFVHAAPPGGESFRALHLRTRHLLDELLETDHPRIAIVAHAGTLRSVLCHVLDLPLEHAFRIALSYGAVVHLRFDRDERMSQLVGLYGG